MPHVWVMGLQLLPIPDSLSERGAWRRYLLDRQRLVPEPMQRAVGGGRSLLHPCNPQMPESRCHKESRTANAIPILLSLAFALECSRSTTANAIRNGSWRRGKTWASHRSPRASFSTKPIRGKTPARISEIQQGDASETGEEGLEVSRKMEGSSSVGGVARFRAAW